MLSGLFKRKDKKVKVDEAAGNVVARQDDNGTIALSPTTSGRGSPSGRASPSIMVPQPSLRTSRSNSNTLKSSLASPSSPLSSTRSQERLQSLQGRKSPVPTAESPRSGVSNDSPKDSSGTTAATQRLVQFTNTNENGPVTTPLTRLRSPEPVYEMGDNKEDDAVPAPIARVRSPEPSYNTTYKPSQPGVFTSRPELNINTTTSHGPAAVISPMSTPGPYTGQFSDPGPSLISPVERPLEVRPNDLVSSTKPMEPQTIESHVTKDIPADGASDTPTNNPIEATPKSSTEDSMPSTTALADSTSPRASSSSSDTTPGPSTPTTEEDPATVNNSNNVDSDPTWDTTALRHYLDTRAHQDVKDMLVIISDTAGVQPLAADDPIMVELGFPDMKRRLDDMAEELDALLLGFLERSARKAGSEGER